MRKDVCNELRERIISVHYKPGEPLNEKKLAEEFGVSRTPIREALIRLSEENMVTIIP
ncbi:MAG: GntR family transcriptional regulator, partial [bacterium]|nr:GntR family transcriptional regulator [bacterium]